MTVNKENFKKELDNLISMVGIYCTERHTPDELKVWWENYNKLQNNVIEKFSPKE